jgi:hypothetical protein
MITMMAAAMLAGAAPAAAPVDPDMLCFVAMAVKAGMATDAGEKSDSYDNAGGFYLALVSRRYPTVAQFAPVMDQAMQEAKDGDLEKIADKCLATTQQAIDLVSKSLASLSK